MEFSSIYEVDEQFFLQFLNEAEQKELPDQPDGTTSPFLKLATQYAEDFYTLLRYAKRSGGEALEEHGVYYPCITINSEAPQVSKKRMLFVKDWFLGGFDIINATVDQIFMPIPLDFRYQVSVACYKKSERDAIEEWFLRKFNYHRIGNGMLLNVTETEEGDLGVAVPFSVATQEVGREDGVFEKIFDFTLETFVHLKASITEEYIQTVLLIFSKLTGEEPDFEFAQNDGVPAPEDLPEDEQELWELLYEKFKLMIVT